MTDALCRTGKIHYATSGEATLAATHLKSRDRNSGRREVDPYRCPFCKTWHLGRGDRRDQQKAKAAQTRADRLSGGR